MKILKKLASTSLVVRILAGLVVGAILGLVIPGEEWISIFGDRRIPLVDQRGQRTATLKKMAIKRIKREKPRRRGASLFKRKDGYGRAVGYVSCLLGAESEGSRPQHAQQYDQNQRDDLFDIIHFQFPLIRLCGSDDPAFHFAFK